MLDSGRNPAWLACCGRRADNRVRPLGNLSKDALLVTKVAQLEGVQKARCACPSVLRLETGCGRSDWVAECWRAPIPGIGQFLRRLSAATPYKTPESNDFRRRCQRPTDHSRLRRQIKRTKCRLCRVRGPMTSGWVGGRISAANVGRAGLCWQDGCQRRARDTPGRTLSGCRPSCATLLPSATGSHSIRRSLRHRLIPW